MLKLIRTTIIGGIIFLIPIAILVAVVGQGLKIAGAIAKPVAAVLPVDMIGGVAVAHVLAIVLLLVICFIAGLLARVALARKAVRALEANVLSKLPAYALLKTKTQSMLSPEDIEGMSAALVRFDDLWQIGFEIERIEGGKVALFLPGCPRSLVRLRPPRRGRPRHAARSAGGRGRQDDATAWPRSERGASRSPWRNGAPRRGLKRSRGSARSGGALLLVLARLRPAVLPVEMGARIGRMRIVGQAPAVGIGMVAGVVRGRLRAPAAR